MYQPNQDNDRTSNSDLSGDRISTPIEPARPGAPIDLNRIFWTLRRGRRWIGAASGIGLVAGLVLAKTVVPRHWEATSVLAWDATPVSATSLTLSTPDDTRRLRTLVDTAKLPTNLAELRRRLAIHATLERIGKDLVVEPGDASNLVTVRGSAEDPNAAKLLTDEFVRVFLDARRQSETARLNVALAADERDLAEAKRDLDALRADYDDFRQKNGVADVTLETQVALQEASRFRSEARVSTADADGERAKATSLGTILRDEPATAQLVAREATPSAAKLAEASAELAVVRDRLAPDHPKVAALEAQIAALKVESDRSASTVTIERSIGINPVVPSLRQAVNSATSQRQGMLERASALDELATTASARAEALTKIEGEASAKLAALKVAETHVAELETLRAKAMDDLRAPSIGLRVVSAATVPDRAKTTARKLVVALLPIASALAVLLFLIGRALKGLRAHGPTEIAFWTRSPVVASTQWPHAGGSEIDLMADLRQAIDDSSVPLVVAASDAEMSVASRIAEGLATSHGETIETIETGEGNFARCPANAATPALRRDVRAAHRVLLVVQSGVHSITELAALTTSIGRRASVEVVVVGVEDALLAGPDRVGTERAVA
jgi:uncharacterized protein involved in exopolysaccharide biosynthesis